MEESHRFATREPTAAAPGPDVEALRSAYLDVLKLCLCDLGGPSTMSVWKEGDGAVMSRELTGADRRARTAGMDWPLHGVTMIGLTRLDDLQACIEQIAQDGVEGDVIEAGTWRGGASILMRATLDTLGDDRTVWVADSFEGLPLPEGEDPDAERLAGIDFLAVPLDEVSANFARFGCERGVRFVPGFFQDTLPELSERRWSLVRLDGDSYEATWTALGALYPGLSVGGHLIVDDYGALEECRRAVDEFRRHHEIAEPLEEVDFTCVRWRRTSAEPIDRRPAPDGARTTNGSARAVPREGTARIPSMQELALERERRMLHRELADARDRLAAAEAQIGLRAWARRRLGRGRAR